LRRASFDSLISETADIDLNQFCKFPGQMLDMYTGASIGVGWILTAQVKNLHMLLIIAWLRELVLPGRDQRM
jgi:hypothetical protein